MELMQGLRPRFPQGVRRRPEARDATWQRGSWHGEPCARLDLPGLRMVVIPRRSTLTAKRIWHVIAGPVGPRLPEPPRDLVMSRRALRDLLRSVLRETGWDALLGDRLPAEPRGEEAGAADRDQPDEMPGGRSSNGEGPAS